jgi:DNA polymerase III epsilon subunit family exonuclease
MDSATADLLPLPIDELPLAFLDVETTGLDPSRGHRICEIAIVRCLGLRPLLTWSTLVDPGRPLDPGAQAVNGITAEMLRGQPRFAGVAPDIAALLDTVVVVGHNTPFDLGFLHAELARLGADLPSFVALDTLRLARALYRARRYGLDALVAALGVAQGIQAHRAAGDALRTHAVFQRIVVDLTQLGAESLEDYLQAQGGPLFWAPSPAPIPPPPVEGDLPSLIAAALQGHYLLRLRYRDVRGGESDRVVRPIRLIDHQGTLTLEAYCHLRDALRTFHLERILEMELVR